MKACLEVDRVRGSLIGVACGDSLGLPVETFSAARIASEVGEVRDFLDPYLNGHLRRDFPPGVLRPGVTSDDTQLSLAVAASIARCGCLDLDDIARAHVEAATVTMLGWGGATRDATARMAEGSSWRDSCIAGVGTGCGPVMKLSPIVAYLVGRESAVIDELDFLAGFTIMTHKTNVAIAGTFAFAAALEYCYRATPESFSAYHFVTRVIAAAELGRTHLSDQPREELLFSRLERLREWSTLTETQMLEITDGADCPMACCLPFALYSFLRGPFSFETVLRTVNAGGDTDSTGGLVGAMIGALNGAKIFPDHFVERVQGIEQVRATANLFHAAIPAPRQVLS